MEELQHGVYDDCEGLTYEEINVLYGFDEEGGLVEEEGYDKSDDMTEEGDEISSYTTEESGMDVEAVEVCFS